MTLDAKGRLNPGGFSSRHLMPRDGCCNILYGISMPFLTSTRNHSNNQRAVIVDWVLRDMASTTLCQTLPTTTPTRLKDLQSKMNRQTLTLFYLSYWTTTSFHLFVFLVSWTFPVQHKSVNSVTWSFDYWLGIFFKINERKTVQSQFLLNKIGSKSIVTKLCQNQQETYQEMRRRTWTFFTITSYTNSMK